MNIISSVINTVVNIVLPAHNDTGYQKPAVVFTSDKPKQSRSSRRGKRHAA